ncbi:MAG: YndJ family transporter [Myxococcales bacterium]|nr:YndJ family transporter [Myxococcales bacterium]
MIAAGNLGHSPVLKFLGVSAMVASGLALAITSTAVAWSVPGRAASLLLLLSAASVAAGMVLAGVYGVGELTGRAWIGIPRTVAIHGLLNALGFTLFGLLGYLRLRLAGGGSQALAPAGALQPR